MLSYRNQKRLKDIEDAIEKLQAEVADLKAKRKPGRPPKDEVQLRQAQGQ